MIQNSVKTASVVASAREEALDISRRFLMRIFSEGKVIFSPACAKYLSQQFKTKIDEVKKQGYWMRQYIEKLDGIEGHIEGRFDIVFHEAQETRPAFMELLPNTYGHYKFSLPEGQPLVFEADEEDFHSNYDWQHILETFPHHLNEEVTGEFGKIRHFGTEGHQYGIIFVHEGSELIYSIKSCWCIEAIHNMKYLGESVDFGKYRR